MKQYQIRADYNQDSIVVYQAYREAIAKPALKEQTFVSPFSLNRMTWIKPSFLWLMNRSNWGQKSGQEYILAIRIEREGWEKALSCAVLTHFEKSVFGSYTEWQKQFQKAKVHLQWDPERSLRGKDLNYDSIQVGLSSHIISEYVNDWIISIEDYREKVKKIYKLIQSGNIKKAKQLIPKEQIYPITDSQIRKRTLIQE